MGRSFPMKSCLKQRSSAYGVSCGQAVKIRQGFHLKDRLLELINGI